MRNIQTVALLVAVLLAWVPAEAQLPTGRQLEAAAGYPHPQDLAEWAWARMPAKLKTYTPTFYKAHYRDEAKTEFLLTTATIKSDGLLVAEYDFVRKDGSWFLQNHYIPHVCDRLNVEYVFWNGEQGQAGIFPPVADAAQTQTLYQLLLAIDGQERSRLQIRPTWDTVRNQPQIDRPRNPDQLFSLVRSWRQSPPKFIGLTVAEPDKSAILWVDDGELWAFLWRLENGRYQLNDWDSEPYKNAAARLCVVPVEQPRVAAVGGGTPVSLTNLLGTPVGQQLLRFFRISALNNREEALTYFADDQLGRQWWADDSASLPALEVASIEVTQSPQGVLDVSYPAGTSFRTLRCELKPSQLRVVELATDARPPSQVVRQAQMTARDVYRLLLDQVSKEPWRLEFSEPGYQGTKEVQETSPKYFLSLLKEWQSGSNQPAQIGLLASPEKTLVTVIPSARRRVVIYKIYYGISADGIHVRRVTSEGNVREKYPDLLRQCNENP